ncbi:MAG: exopolysaccharide biosynthesis protein [Alphaproteobacteria bacterium]|nr:MAG: exopolysaccharide biosynthesis protein [Alphaproteobacteria bacterium]
MTHLDLVDAGVGAPKRAAAGFYARLGKRLLDVALILIFLPLLIPLITGLGLMARLDGGPGFYGHKRIGRDGRVFRCWKVRTMVANADQVLQDTLRGDPKAATEWARGFKLKNDPRVTRLGRILRKTSLDELPQIWNVLRGDMSLVGPRPITTTELIFYGTDQQVYLSQCPGVTGMWQVHGRRDGCYSRRVRLDRQYSHEVGLRTDVGLILRTVLCVLARTGS